MWRVENVGAGFLLPLWYAGTELSPSRLYTDIFTQWARSAVPDLYKQLDDMTALWHGEEEGFYCRDEREIE